MAIYDIDYEREELNVKTIMFVSPTGTFDNGAEVSIYYLMLYLKQQGHNIINVAPKSTMNNQSDYVKRYQEQGIEVHLISCVKWWWEDAPGGVAGLPSQRAASYRETVNQLIQISENFKVDLVITNTINMFQGMVAAACTQVPHYTLIHEFPSGEFSYYLDKIDFIQSNSDRIFSVDGNLNDTLKKEFTTPVEKFIPYTEIKPTTLQKGANRRIVSVGRLSYRKNQLELIQAFHKLTLDKEYQELELVLIGPCDEPYKKECDQYIKDHNVKNVIFTGILEDPWSAVSNQDICVFPSSLETYGLVYVEALLNGVPTVLSDNPGHLSAYHLFDFGTIYSLGNTDDLVGKIVSTLKDFALTKKAAMDFIPAAKERYQIKNVYGEILSAIINDQSGSSKSIRHVQNLLTLNEPKSKLAKLETKTRINLQRIKNRLKR